MKNSSNGLFTRSGQARDRLITSEQSRKDERPSVQLRLRLHVDISACSARRPDSTSLRFLVEARLQSFCKPRAEPSVPARKSVPSVLKDGRAVQIAEPCVQNAVLRKSLPNLVAHVEIDIATVF